MYTNSFVWLYTWSAASTLNVVAMDILSNNNVWRRADPPTHDENNTKYTFNNTNNMYMQQTNNMKYQVYQVFFIELHYLVVVLIIATNNCTTSALFCKPGLLSINASWRCIIVLTITINITLIFCQPNDGGSIFS